MNKPTIKIDIITDVVCPWCYIGEHRLHKAIEDTSNHFNFELTLKPFELDPNTPKEGKDHLSYLIKLMGNEARVKEAHAMMEEMGEAEGLHYDFDKIKIIPNTLNAHRLIWLAKQYNAEGKVAEALYRSNFSEGKDVNDLNILIGIGSEYGIPKKRLEEFFAGEEGRKEVISMEEDSHRARINSVPAFIVNNKYIIRGAQSPATFKEAFQRIATERNESSTGVN